MAVKSTGCFYKGSEFGSQHPHGSLQPPVIPSPEDPMPPFGLHRCQTHRGAHTSVQPNIHIYIYNKNKYIFKITRYIIPEGFKTDIWLLHANACVPAHRERDRER